MAWEQGVAERCESEGRPLEIALQGGDWSDSRNLHLNLTGELYSEYGWLGVGSVHKLASHRLRLIDGNDRGILSV